MEEGDNKAITLDKDIDLYKIPINVLKDSKLSYFKGKLISEILEQMMKVEDKSQILAKDIIKNNQKKNKILAHKVNNQPKSPDKTIYKTKNIQKMYNSFNNSNNLNNMRLSNNKMNNSAYLKVKPSRVKFLTLIYYPNVEVESRCFHYKNTFR